jgi:anti-sigma-K factor RskA
VSHEPYDTLAPDYATGALDGDDLARFEAHLPTCAECQAAVRDARDTLGRAMLTALPQGPPPGVPEALVRRVGGGRGWLRWAAATAVAAAAAAGFAAAWVAVRYEARLGQMARETTAVKERLARNEAALREQVALYRGAVELLRDPATRVVDLRGQGPAAAASGRMLWNDAGGGHLFVAGLPPAPAGKTYELWIIAGKIPRPGGLFGVDEAGRSAHRVPPEAAAGAVDVFAVTLEPEGGTRAPTGPVVLASKEEAARARP